MQNFNEVELIDVEKQLSLTEKAIMDACDVCKCLDASKNAPNMEGWPISKVSILLIDGKKENCFLLFGSITEGVWSVVEKSIDASSQNSEVTPEMNNTNKRKRVVKKSKKEDLKVDEDGLLQIGYSAVKEATGNHSCQWERSPWLCNCCSLILSLCLCINWHHKSKDIHIFQDFPLPVYLTRDDVNKGHYYYSS